MVNKKHVESLLKANGVPATAADEEIRSVLLSAKWNHNEVDTALMVLKENKIDHTTRVDTLHKVFQTDGRLSSSEISALLGIDVYIDNEDELKSHYHRLSVDRLQSFVALVLSLIIAFTSLGYVMYKENIGPFHPTSAYTIPELF